jgi:hypothetical protein
MFLSTKHYYSWEIESTNIFTEFMFFQSLTQRQDEDRAKLEQASELVSQVEQYKQMEVELKDSLAKVRIYLYPSGFY